MAKRCKMVREPFYTADPGIAGQSKCTRLRCRKIIHVGLNTTSRHAIGHLSSTTAPSGGETTLHIATVESKTDKSLHLEHWHGEKNHNNILKTSTTPVSVTAVGAKALCFHSTAHPCHRDAPRTASTSTSHMIQIWHETGRFIDKAQIKIHGKTM